MGGLSGLIGTDGGASGTGFAGPSAAGITSGTTPQQVLNSYNQVQQGMQGQQGLLAALQNQNGLSNQSQVYNQLQGVANGTGPNPAQAMLNQATGQNVANQAALMAGQRGAGSNVGLMARQAAQQGAATQQQAVGQGATMQANQSLNALSSAGNMANTMAGNQIAQTNSNVAASQAEQGNLLNTQNSYNNALTSMQSNINNVNGQLANTDMQGQQAMIGGLMNSASSAMKMVGARGGAVGKQESAAPAPQTPAPSMYASGGPVSMFGQSVNETKGPAESAGAGLGEANAGAKALKQGTQSLATAAMKPSAGQPTQTVAGGPNDATMPTTLGAQQPMMTAAKGGKVPALVSPGERYLPPSEVTKVAKGVTDPMKAGEKIPGKAKVKGAVNSYANDTVPKTLDEGGIIIPRSITQSKNPSKKAGEFVAAIMKKKALGKG